MGEQSARARRIPAGQRSAFSVQHSAFSTALPIPAPPRPSSLAPQYSALSTQHSVLSTRSSTLAPRPSALSTQYSVLATPPSPPGLTLPETLIATFLLALLLFVTAQGVEHVRNQLKTARTWEMLAQLDQALEAYHSATGAWPAPSTSPKRKRGTPSERESPLTSPKRKRGIPSESESPLTSPEPQLTVASEREVPLTNPKHQRGTPSESPLTSPKRKRGISSESEGRPLEPDSRVTAPTVNEDQPTSAPTLDEIVTAQGGPESHDESIRAARHVLAALRAVPASARMIRQIEARSPGAAASDPLRDAWGCPLRCLTAQSSSAADRQAVAAHGGRPIFVSPGPNPAIGLRSDEIPRQWEGH